ncbi:hypothetical protein HD_1502 [[Haemophilus] ducreyi 35000HP]|uniref:Uncharacterized protein n=1 Tax=Haemophilus ducreyi (strain 35000HP / ATCC 700724) TaxID=233412 RepID=Q7VLF1_HAEDU|nr:hypothetical protein HD_1502 [[Haemophilus] ducreyi 35000HP]
MNRTKRGLEKLRADYTDEFQCCKFLNYIMSA